MAMSEGRKSSLRGLLTAYITAPNEASRTALQENITRNRRDDFMDFFDEIDLEHTGDQADNPVFHLNEVCRGLVFRDGFTVDDNRE